MELTIKIDIKSHAAKILVEYLKTLPFVKVEEEGEYDKDFVDMVLEAKREIKDGEGLKISSDDFDDLWK